VRKNYSWTAPGAVPQLARVPSPGIPLLEEHPFFRKQVKYVLRTAAIIDPESVADYRRPWRFKAWKRHSPCPGRR